MEIPVQRVRLVYQDRLVPRVHQVVRALSEFKARLEPLGVLEIRDRLGQRDFRERREVWDSEGSLELRDCLVLLD